MFNLVVIWSMLQLSRCIMFCIQQKYCVEIRQWLLVWIHFCLREQNYQSAGLSSHTTYIVWTEKDKIDVMQNNNKKKTAFNALKTRFEKRREKWKLKWDNDIKIEFDAFGLNMRQKLEKDRKRGIKKKKKKQHRQQP